VVFIRELNQARTQDWLMGGERRKERVSLSSGRALGGGPSKGGYKEEGNVRKRRNCSVRFRFLSLLVGAGGVNGHSQYLFWAGRMKVILSFHYGSSDSEGGGRAGGASASGKKGDPMTSILDYWDTPLSPEPLVLRSKKD